MPSPYEHSLRKVAAKIHPTPTGRPFTRLGQGIVHTVTAGASLDGAAAVMVTVDGEDIPAAYLASYTPVAGHTVAVAFTGGSPLILGHIVGLPNF